MSSNDVTSSSFDVPVAYTPDIAAQQARYISEHVDAVVSYRLGPIHHNQAALRDLVGSLQTSVQSLQDILLYASDTTNTIGLMHDAYRTGQAAATTMAQQPPASAVIAAILATGTVNGQAVAANASNPNDNAVYSVAPATPDLNSASVRADVRNLIHQDVPFQADTSGTSIIANPPHSPRDLFSPNPEDSEQRDTMGRHPAYVSAEQRSASLSLSRTRPIRRTRANTRTAARNARSPSPSDDPSLWIPPPEYVAWCRAHGNRLRREGAFYKVPNWHAMMNVSGPEDYYVDACGVQRHIRDDTAVAIPAGFRTPVYPSLPTPAPADAQTPPMTIKREESEQYLRTPPLMRSSVSRKRRRSDTEAEAGVNVEPKTNAVGQPVEKDSLFNTSDAGSSSDSEPVMNSGNSTGFSTRHPAVSVSPSPSKRRRTGDQEPAARSGSKPASRRAGLMQPIRPTGARVESDAYGSSIVSPSRTLRSRTGASVSPQ